MKWLILPLETLELIFFFKTNLFFLCVLAFAVKNKVFGLG